MKVTCDPIFHKPEYDDLMEAEILAYLRDVIFEPLFRLLGDAGLRENTIEDWGWFPRGWGSLGIPRSQMPQIRGECRGELLAALSARGVPHCLMGAFVASLQPTQSEYSPTKVEQARKHVGEDRPILIASDGHILDGHHQWVAKMLDNPKGTMPVQRIDMPIRELIDFVMNRPALRANERPKNEHSALWDALVAGLVWYSAGVFTGKFNAAISRELRAIGARKIENGFYLEPADLPMVLRGIISLAASKSVALHEAILAQLDQSLVNLPVAEPGITFSKTVDIVVPDLQKQLKRTVSSVEGLPVPSPVPPGLANELREKLSAGAGHAIKNFSLEATQQLRAKVKLNLSDGARTDRLAKVIEVEFGVSKRKARIIAATETSQLVSDFREIRYRSLGSSEYDWSTSGDEKVRPTHGESNNHRVLNGRRFPWASPPVVDSATGRRCHPGQDYGPCRCVARPVFNLA